MIKSKSRIDPPIIVKEIPKDNPTNEPIIPSLLGALTQADIPGIKKNKPKTSNKPINILMIILLFFIYNKYIIKNIFKN
jgi:hypothetical protein